MSTKFSKSFACLSDQFNLYDLDLDLDLDLEPLIADLHNYRQTSFSLKKDNNHNIRTNINKDCLV